MQIVKEYVRIYKANILQKNDKVLLLYLYTIQIHVCYPRSIFQKKIIFLENY